MAEDMRKLKLKRGQVKGQLTRFDNFLKGVDKDNLTLTIIKELSTRLSKVQGCFDLFSDLQNEIELLSPDEADSNDRLEFENTYFSLTSQTDMLIEQFYKKDESIRGDDNLDEGSSIRTTGSRNDNINSNFIKLPTIKLPTFNGDYGSWLEFRDLFSSLVDNNVSLNPIQKFYHLKTSLSNEPRKIIAKLDTTAANYDIAWQMLKQRYENKGLMIHNHIKGIFEKTPMTRESHVELRELYDSINDHLSSLKTLGEEVTSWDRLIIYILTQKFDNITRRGWESYKYEGDLPTMQDMQKFLSERCQMLEKLANDKPEKAKHFTANKFKKSSVSSSFVATEMKCYFCQKEHAIYKCPDFLKLSTTQRNAEVKKRGLCLNCLNPSHSVKECRFKKCFKCHRLHNTLLHIEYRLNTVGGNIAERAENMLAQESTGSRERDESRPVAPIAENSSISHTVEVFNSHAATVAGQILLSTAIVKIKIDDTYFKARALLDSGSQCNFITERFCNKINANKLFINHTIKGVGQNIIKINHKVHLNLQSVYDEFKYETDFLIINKITDKLPRLTFSKNVIDIPANLNLADPYFNISDDIDLLLGSDFLWKVLTTGHKELGQNLPVLHNSKLGWIIAGDLGVDCNASISCHCIDDDENIDSQISRFWVLEDVNNKNRFLTMDEKYCEDHFENTFTRDHTNRFVVEIPFRDNLKELGESREIALNRFYNLEKRLMKNIDLKNDYLKFMEEYERLNHMTKINENLETVSNGYYIPHHAVVKQSSLTSRCRVVFNASCPTNSGLSLNDVQYPGPALQNDIFDILLRFRKYKYVIAADISKMYRQILIKPNQRHFQRIFWRSNVNNKLECFELNTVTYGTASAPYLAVRCLIQLALENSESFPVASKIIANDFYIDDLLTGADSKNEILQIQKDVSLILSKSGFELRKWLSNNPNLINEFVIHENLDVNILPIGDEINNKTLGIYWNANLDLVQYVVPINNEERIKLTKRGILSIICKIYDPLGLISPIIITGKFIIQTLWKLKISWDTKVPENIAYCWNQFYKNLNLINDLQIPRQCLISEYIFIELHGFSDASEKAYAAACYIRGFCLTKGYFSFLLCSKSRLAPLKQVSLPRLELCGALLLSNLTKRVVSTMKINFTAKYYWTDSTITLAWIRGEPSKWKTFVANRVSEIQSLTNINEWFHVASKDNPADILSRGIDAQDLLTSELWWHGPSWLLIDKNNWNLEIVYNHDILLPESRNVTVSCMAVSSCDFVVELIKRYSSFLKLLRVTAYILRFLHNLKKGNIKSIGVLTPNELDAALLLLIKTVQIECFSSEYDCLMKKKPLHTKSKLLSLKPFFHNDVLRVGGRLDNADFGFERKHQLILPKNHLLTDLIITYEHKRLLHCGVQNLVCAIREKYWVLSCRNTCKKIVRSCIKCFKVKPKENSYIMGDLPACRVNEFLPFVNVGVDYGGPFMVKDRKGRGAKVTKAYVCLFICMSSKAVHLELVSSLTTDGFLNAVKRFVSRRGKPSNIYSDNGSNFIGASRQLQELYDFLCAESNTISDFWVNEKIRWHFIPSRSPTFGGVWEAGIKSMKFHLKRVIGESTLTFEDFYTVLNQVESILNSRPLCPLSSDADDLTPLTPAHLLINRSLVALPEENVTTIPENRLNQYQKLQQLSQHFWTRWSREYVNELQTRVKWTQNASKLLKVGDLVVLKNENLPPIRWQLGRVVNMFPGSDGVCRVADVRTTKGVVRRALTKLCVLPNQ